MLDAHNEIIFKEGNFLIHNGAIIGGGIYVYSWEMIDFTSIPPSILTFQDNFAYFGNNWASIPISMEIVQIRALIQNRTFFTNHITAFSNEPLSITVRLKDGYNHSVNSFELLFVKLQLHKGSKEFQLSSLEFEREVIPDELEFLDVRLSGPIGKTGIIHFITTKFELELLVYVTLLPCPAGWYRDEPEIYKCLPCPIGTKNIQQTILTTR